jgi:hypothetical protein
MTHSDAIYLSRLFMHHTHPKIRLLVGVGASIHVDATL